MLWEQLQQMLPQYGVKQCKPCLRTPSSLPSMQVSTPFRIIATCTCGKSSSSMCQLCHQPNQSLIHVLNYCSMALQLRRYNERHDEVLKVIANSIQNTLPSTTKLTTDLGGEYHFPSHIAPTDLCPDIV